MTFASFFDPASVALIGARPEDGHVGSAIMKNLLRGKKRTIYPVSDKYPEVLGVVSVPSVPLLPEAVDLAIIAVAAESVPQVLRDCRAKGIRSVVVISAGFKEAGGRGVILEREVHDIAKESGIALLGPNCLGVIDGNRDLNASFALDKPLPGSISFVSQSGAIGTSFIEWSRDERVGISKFVSMGNEAGISELEMLEYLGDDPETKAILLYLEHVSDGRALLSLARRIVREKKKPIVLLRAGRSARGAQAVMSHTGSLAPEDEVFVAASRQAGIATVETLRDLFNAAKLLSIGTDWGDKTRIAIVTNGGGPSVNAADLVELSESMELVRFDDDMQSALRNVLPPMAAVGNPVDVIGDAGSDRYRAALDIVLSKAETDAVMVIVTPQMMTDPKAIAEVVVDAARRKPVIPVFMGESVMDPGVRYLNDHGLTNFDVPSDAIAALDALTPKRKHTAPRPTHAASQRRVLSFPDSATLLAPFGLSPAGTFVRSKEEALAALHSHAPSPVALKALSGAAIHKSDANVVRLHIANEKELAEAWDDLTRRIGELNGTIDGMLVQPMYEGKELIVGMKRDVTFGPTVVLGLGGIFTELARDVSVRVAPLSIDDAYEMMQELRAARYLEHYRNTEAIDRTALARLLVAVGELALREADLMEIDLNPVIANGSELTLVDVRMVARG